MNTIRPRANAGFSLVELMVALVVGLLLLAGVLQILLGNRESFEAQRGLADVQEQGRLASFFIENVIAHAGHRVDLIADEEFLFSAENTDDGFTLVDGGVVSGIDSGEGEGDDAVHVRFESDGNFRDCTGAAVGTPDTPVVGNFSLSVDDTGILRCNGVPLTEEGSVARFRVRYGLDTDADKDNVVDAYVDALGNDDTQLDVRSLRLQLLLRSDENVLAQGFARDFEFADGSTFTSTDDDRRAYQFIDQTVALRNLLP
ncbi:type 4 fimbrial biogenesis protein PilW [Salinisphaera dokdonensis CL-ES53]|uniref:Type 4 fimbrial biogenesis protein PilW n=2 Tax=Salinisphaera TaxID=180541 RepID=A0ABV2B4B5_9GAMM